MAFLSKWLRRSKRNNQPRLRRSPRGLRVEPLESRRLLSAVVMNDWEQLMIELVNRARMDPAAEAARYDIGLNDNLAPGTISDAPKQPLAPHQALVNAAAAHSQDMLNRDFFSHTNPDGESPWDRMQEAGYDYILAGENISWTGSTGTLDRDGAIYVQHEGLFKSAGHRTNILGPDFHEIGAGVRHGVFTTNRDYNASVTTEKFGTRSGDPFVTGVVYDDLIVQDDFYTIGEGWGDVSLTAVEESSGIEYVTQSGPSGGYALRLPAGTYTVTASGGDLNQPVARSGIVVGTENRKLDFEVAAGAVDPPPSGWPWQNPDNPLDVNADGRVTAIDALVVINHLNRNGAGPLPTPSTPGDPPPPPYLDVQANGAVGPLDALLIINHLNRFSGATRGIAGEGEMGDAAVASLASLYASSGLPGDTASGLSEQSFVGILDDSVAFTGLVLQSLSVEHGDLSPAATEQVLFL